MASHSEFGDILMRAIIDLPPRALLRSRRPVDISAAVTVELNARRHGRIVKAAMHDSSQQIVMSPGDLLTPSTIGNTISAIVRERAIFDIGESDVFHKGDVARRTSPSVIPNERLVRLLSKAICDHDEERLDIKRRVSLIVDALQPDMIPVPFCMDYFGLDEMDLEVKTIKGISPPCQGDGRVHFSKFNGGLIGDGSICGVCDSVVDVDAAVVGLPCMHLMHERCSRGWLASRDNCPTCDYTLPMAGHLYSVNANEQTYARISEFFVSGMCHQCQAFYQERDPLLSVDLHDGLPPHLIVRSALPRLFVIGR